MTAKTVVPGTDCPLPGNTCDGAAALDTAREAAEGEAFQPTGNWTLTDVYDGGPFYGPGISNSSANHGELGVAAESTKALIAPTELYDVQTQRAEVTNRGKWNDAHRIIVDDGSSNTYSTTAEHRDAVPVDDAHLRPAGRRRDHVPGPDDPDQGLLGLAAAPEQPGRRARPRPPSRSCSRRGRPTRARRTSVVTSSSPPSTC